MKAVCRTDNSKPSQSLIITICFPQSFCFQVNKQQTTSHEQFAKEQYIKETEEKHTDFVVKDSGVVINPMLPFVGASPDGVVSCKCCGVGHWKSSACTVMQENL